MSDDCETEMERERDLHHNINFCVRVYQYAEVFRCMIYQNLKIRSHFSFFCHRYIVENNILVLNEYSISLKEESIL